MGDAFYRTCPLVYSADRIADVPKRLREALHAGPFDPAKGAPYFEAAWRRSFPGELYISDPALLDTFTASLQAALAEPAAAR
jgi:hypothetical protein